MVNTHDILCLSDAGMPAAAADMTDEALDMRREWRRRRRLISEAVGDPMAMGTTTDVIWLVPGLGLVWFGDCTSTMASSSVAVELVQLVGGEASPADLPAARGGRRDGLDGVREPVRCANPYGAWKLGPREV